MTIYKVVGIIMLVCVFFLTGYSVIFLGEIAFIIIPIVMGLTGLIIIVEKKINNKVIDKKTMWLIGSLLIFICLFGVSKLVGM